MLRSLFAQQAPFTFEVLVVDSGSSEAEIAAMCRFPIRLSRIPAEEFGHGRTRNLLARQAQGEVLVLLSQDAEPASADWLATLVAPLRDPSVAGVYGRQISRQHTDPLMRFTLSQLYGSLPNRRRLRPGMQPRLEMVFFSNVSSAIRRTLWQRFPFREDVMMSEDAYWAWDVLQAGFEVAYEPTARVYHTHRYGLRGVFQRHWMSGASLRDLIAEAPSGISWRGLTYVLREAAFLVREGRIHWLPYMVLYEAAKAAGFGLGMAGWRVPPTDRASRTRRAPLAG